MVDDISRDDWHAVVIRMRVSAEDDCTYEVWWDGVKVYSSTGINVGFSSWTGDTIGEEWYFQEWHVHLRYALQDMTLRMIANFVLRADHDAYTDATWSIVLDNVKWYKTDDGEDDGYETVVS